MILLFSVANHSPLKTLKNGEKLRGGKLHCKGGGVCLIVRGEICMLQAMVSTEDERGVDSGNFAGSRIGRGIFTSGLGTGVDSDKSN